jgi:NitT/TauT family transport system substrate-binding protein
MTGEQRSGSADCLRIGIVSRTFYYVPWWAAIRLNRFSATGMPVTLELLGNDDPVQAIRSGRCDIAISPPDAILRDVDAGGDSVILAGNADRLSHRLIVQPEIERFGDLRGRRIGVLSRTEGSFFHFQLLAHAHGLRFPDDFEVVETGGAPLRHRLLLEGRIDAGLQSLPWVYIEEEAGLRNLLDVSTFVPVWQFNTVNADRSWYVHNREPVKRFLQVLRSATEDFYSHSHSMAVVATQEMGVSYSEALRAWRDLVDGRCLTKDLSVNRKGLRLVHESLARSGLTRRDRPYDEARYLSDCCG